MAMTDTTTPDRPPQGGGFAPGAFGPNAQVAYLPGGRQTVLTPAQDPSGQNVYWGPQQTQQGQQGQGQQGQGPPQYGQMRTPGSPMYGQVFQGPQGALPQGAQQVYQGSDGNYYTSYRDPFGQGWTGAAQVGPSPWQAPPQPQQQQQAPQGFSADQLKSILSQITPSTAATGQSASPTGLTAAAVPGGQATTAQATPTATIPSATPGSLYNLAQSFQQPQPQQGDQRGGRVPRGYQGGGQVSNQNQGQPFQYQTSTDWLNPMFATSELGAAALRGGGGYGTPVVINPTPNQGPQGQGNLVGPTGVYTGPQQATVLGQLGGGPGSQTYTPQGPWNYQPGVLSGPAGSQTTQMLLPGGGKISPGASQQISGLYQDYQNGDQSAGVALEQLRGSLGLSVDQTHSMINDYNQSLKNVYTQAYPGGAPNQTPLTAMTPANAAQARPSGPTPFATAPMPGGQALPAPAMGMPGIASFGGGMGMQPPPAPGAPTPMMAQGPPGVAAPTAFGGAYTGYTAGVPGIQPVQPYTGTVHNDPFMSHAVSTLLGLPSNPWHAPDGSPRGGGMPVSTGGGGATAQAASMALATAPKTLGGGPTAAQGVPPGWTPGPGGSLLGALPSNVPPPSPALAGITPPAGAPTSLPAYPGGGPPKKMQAGGYVRGYADGGSVDNREPSEVRRGTLTVPQSGGSQSSQPSQPQGQTQSGQQAVATVSNVGNAMSNLYGGQPPGTGASVAPAAPGIGTLAGEQAYVTGEPVSGIPSGGLSQAQGNAIAGGIGAIGGAFQQALNKTAQTPWRWQPAGAWANPQNVPKESEPQFKQEQVPQ